MRLVQVAAHAEDLDQAEAFYSLLTGTAPTARFDPPGLLFFDLDGTRLLLERGAPPATIYLEVADVAAALDRLRDAATVAAEPHVIFTHEDDALGPAGTQEWHAFVTDPFGNTIGLVGFGPP
jgi:methylmalonyl-CoA/ethylmalonyl-CoA epimerase